MAKCLTKRPFAEGHHQTVYDAFDLVNVSLSRCYSCNEFSIWLFDKIIYPEYSFAVEPNEDLPPDVLLDFQEAANIVANSPRGAAALLRLCIQKIFVHLGEKGDRIDNDIASLVRKGLEPQVQQALDIVRVIGNEAVHPGQIDLRDNRDTAMRLFALVNLVVEAMISRPKHIKEMYDQLPETKRAATQRRDGTEAG